MTRSHRNEDRGGEHRWTFNGVEYPTRKLMCEARRAEYVRLLDEEGMNFTQAAHAVGVSKRTGKAWRNGRTRATGRNEKPLVDWYRSTMDKPKTLHPRYLSQEERIQIADRLRLGDSIRAIARLLGAELALHKRIGASLDMAVYFCDPHSPWQRGTNENTNGLLRQYFPKGTDLSVYPEDYLDAVAEELNDRPRKTLGFMKPSEKIIELLDAA